MATVNQGRIRHSLGDYDRQRGQFSFDTTVITAANHDAQKTQHDNLIAAIADVTLGTLDFEEFVADREEIRPMVWPTAAAAQKHIQWIFSYTDDVTGSTFNVRIPTADILDDTLFAAALPQWDPADAKWVTLIAAFELHVLAPITSNAVTLALVTLAQ